MFGGLSNITRVSEQGKEQADTGNYKRKVRLLLNKLRLSWAKLKISSVRVVEEV